jgi:PAS domain S-box-containing protein
MNAAANNVSVAHSKLFSAQNKKPTIWPVIFVVAVLTISLSVTFLLWQKEQRHVQGNVLEVFDAKTDQAVVKFKQHFQSVEEVLHAADGLFAATQGVQAAEFHRFIASLRLKEKYPEIREVGFVAALPDAHAPGGRRAPVTLFESVAGDGHSALGRDLSADRVRREALALAAGSGSLAVSNKIRLPGESEDEAQFGYRLYWPIYRNGVQPRERGSRERDLRGWAFVSLNLGAVLQSFSRDSNQVAIDVYDGDDMLDEAQARGNVRDRVGGDSSLKMLVAARSVEIGGYRWTLVAHALPENMAVAGEDHSGVILRAGGIVAVLLALFSWLMMRAAQHAQAQQNVLEQHREALRLSEHQLQAVLDTAPVGIWWMDETGRYRFANKAICDMIGVSEQRLLQATSLLEILVPEEAEQCLRSDRECLQGDGTHHTMEAAKFSDGKVHKLAITKVKLFDSEGNCLGLIGVAVDVSEQQERETALQDLLRTKSAFLANMSHEIRTPMNSVLGMTRLALESAPEGKQRDYLGKIQESGQLLLRIIDDILDLSKIEAGKLEIEMTDFDLNTMISSIVNLLGERARLKGIALRVECPPQIPRLRGDVLRLRQVLINLADNAIKFTAHGEVVIRVLETEDATGVNLRFEIEDSGIGMSAAEMERLFQPFQQADMSTTRQYGGSGLGLSICKRLVELMGGQIGVSSQPQHGSLFWFNLQLARAPRLAPPPETNSNPAPDISKLRGAKLLLAENNPFNQEVAIEFLNKAGAKVQVANNGIEALHWLNRKKFDCVLMDVQMPEMDGLEATRQIRHNPAWAELPVIAMTANAFEEDRKQCLAAGMNDFISKPMQPEQLYAVIVKSLSAEKNGGEIPAPQPAEASLSPANTLVVLDLSELYERLEHDRAKAAEFVRRFVQLARADMATLESALQTNDKTALANWGHHWKSPAFMIGAQHFLALCRQVEMAGKGYADLPSNIAADLQRAADAIEARLEHALASLV